MFNSKIEIGDMSVGTTLKVGGISKVIVGDIMFLKNLKQKRIFHQRKVDVAKHLRLKELSNMNLPQEIMAIITSSKLNQKEDVL